MPLKKVTTTHIRTVSPSTATTPGSSHANPVRTRTASAAMLAANIDHTSHVSATGTSGDAAVVSGSDPTVVVELRPDIVVRSRPLTATLEPDCPLLVAFVSITNVLVIKPFYITK